MTQAATVHALGGMIPIGSRILSADVALAAGQAIAITASVAGTIVLSWAKGGTTTRTVAVGDNIYPGAFVMFASGGGATITLVELWDCN